MQVLSWLKDTDFTKGLKIDKMFENNKGKEIRITMPKDVVMKEHKAPGKISVQVLQGQIWFEVQGDRHIFEQGDMITLDALVPHSLGGIENSIIRLSLSKNDSVERVKNI